MVVAFPDCIVLYRGERVVSCRDAMWCDVVWCVGIAQGTRPSSVYASMLV